MGTIISSTLFSFIFGLKCENHMMLLLEQQNHNKSLTAKSESETHAQKISFMKIFIFYLDRLCIICIVIVNSM